MRLNSVEQSKSETTRKAPNREVRQTGALTSGVGDSVGLLLGLQRAHGNDYVQGLLRSALVQPKLAISEPGDQYEQEADRVADEVMGMSDSAPPATTQPGGLPQISRLQRKCSQCEEELQRQSMDEEEEKPLQPKETAEPRPEVTSEVQSQIDSLRGGGQPLPESVRAFFEPRFGYDFSQVRIHTDARAAESAQAVHAQAYTVGSDVVFGAGRYAPESREGQRLLAHELTHVVQQGAVASSPPAIQRACGSVAIGAPAGCATQPSIFVPGYSFFRFNSNCDDLAPGEKARLITTATALPASAAFEVHGFTSTAGDPTFNQNLSCARALKARTVLTDASPAGAGIVAARITGVFNHGPTPGPSAGRSGVVITPPLPTSLPSAVPAPGATDFRITQVGTSTTSRIFFSRGSSLLNALASAKIKTLRFAPPGSVRLIGYASADEAAAVATDRATAVRAALTAPAVPASGPDPAQSPVTVTSAVGNAAATASRSDFTSARSVEIVVGGAAPAVLDCSATDPITGALINPPKQPCSVMDPATKTAFDLAMPIANDAMTRAVAAVAGVPNATDAPVIDRFFGNHSAATLTTLRTNLGNLKTHVSNLTTPGITQCGGQCDIGGCDEGPIAYNTGVDAASTMTLCVPVFKGLHLNDRARNLIHESAHGTTPLGGPIAPGEGTRDVAYRHERMLFQLAPADRLRNSDSYALFALFLRAVQMTGSAVAVPPGISTPASDTLTGFGGDEPALRLALARLEKRLTWAEDWTGQLYGQVNEVRTGALTWAASWARNLMREASARFPLTAPPASPTLTDQSRIAGMLDRYERMKIAVKRNLSVTRIASGVVRWPPSMPLWVAGASLEIGPDFFRATPEDQVSLLLENLARATRDVEVAFVPAYVSLAKWIHDRNP